MVKKIKKLLTFFVIVPIIFLVISPVLIKNTFATTGINRQINFQGKLVNNTSGINVSNNNYTIVFSLYNHPTNGSPDSGYLWKETQTVTVTDGIFRVALGSQTPFPTDFNFNWDGLYLGMKVGADNEMTPRIRMAAVPYAFNAEKVAGLTVQDENGNASTSGTFKVANGKILTFNESFTTGSHAITFTTTNTTSLTLPTQGTLLSGLSSIGQTMQGTQTTGTVFTLTDTAGLTGEIKGLAINLTSATNSQNKTGLSFDLSGGTSGTYYDLYGTNGSWKITRDGALTVASCVGCGGGDAVSLWSTNEGLLFNENQTMDFAIGGTSTASAKFAVLNMIGTGIPTASISAVTTGTGLSLGGDGVIQSTRKNTLTFGGDKTGNITFSPNNTSTMTLTNGKVGIGLADPGFALDVLGDIRIRENSLIIATNDAWAGWARELLQIQTGGGTDLMNLGGYGSNGTSISYLYMGNTYNDAALKVTSTGNVGIGLTGYSVPAQKLEVLSAAGGTQLRLSSTLASRYTDIKTDQLGYLSISPSGLIATLAGTLNPEAANTYDIGSVSRYWNNVYANKLDLSGIAHISDLLNVDNSLKVNSTSTNTALLVNKSSVADTNPTWSTGLINNGDTRGRSNATGVLNNNKMYVYGGWDDVSYVNTMWVYDVTNNSWSAGTTNTSDTYGRGSHSAVVYNNKMYVYGGSYVNGGNQYHNTLLIYDFGTNTWSTGATNANDASGRSEHTAAVYNNKMYVYGGYTQSTGSLNTLAIYDFATNSWSTGATNANDASGRRSSKNVVYNNKLYIYGGSSLNTMAIYDLVTNTWSVGTTNSGDASGRSNYAIALYNNKIYAYGGYTNVNTNTMTIYDLVTNTWSVGTTNSGDASGRSAAASVLHNNKMYVYSGFNGSNRLKSMAVYDFGYRQNIFSIVENNSSSFTFKTGGILNLDQGFVNILGGNVGIGTTSNPGANLEVLSATTAVASVSATTSGYGLKFEADGTNGAVIESLRNGTLTIGGSKTGNIVLSPLNGTGIVTIGNETNGLRFDIANGGPLYRGTARPTKTIVLSPEYAGATLTASGSGTINGSLTSDNTLVSGGWKNYYQWTTTQAGDQDYTIAVRVTLPSDFDGWQTGSCPGATCALEVEYLTGLTNSANNNVAVWINNADNTPGTNICSMIGASTTITSMGCTSTQLANSPGINNAGSKAIILIRLQADNTSQAAASVGDIILRYYANK